MLIVFIVLQLGFCYFYDSVPHTSSYKVESVAGYISMINSLQLGQNSNQVGMQVPIRRIL